eukprot:CAMPEP_0198211454 /NCGR_PEP_ID=MMETSP1445-20131203/23973_1 /TAXON_ID=36898 /ORGANISM="Pyramimonas sp., Strain CCMP2087" /LENGTH=838 /DNA_ID=CAMNT_0043885717 /DNA_START=197 /DNA_END=2713 /DNA_ORIENTATION=+
MVMDLFRSEEMMLAQLIIPADAAHETITLLGQVGMFQFKDLNTDKSAFQRTYANQVKRCDEMLRKLRFFNDQITKADIMVSPKAGIQRPYDLDELEAKLEELESELLEVNGNQDKLSRSHSELVELQLVLEKAGGFFDEAMTGANTIQEELHMRETFPERALSIEEPLLPDSIELQETGGMRNLNQLGFVTGLVLTEKAASFERVLFRATRGNMFLKLAHIEGKVNDPALGTKMEKSVFVVFFAGERARTKILKLCEAVGANRYPFPEDRSRQRHMNAEVNARLRELHVTLEAGTRQSETLLGQIAQNLADWNLQVSREKAVYHTLNKLSIDVTRKCLIAEGWCPTVARRRIVDAIDRATYQSSAQVNTIFKELNTKEMPPTFFQTNKVTEVFQDIVEAYGVARYREVNPAVFTIVTFPFLFAVMFGDLGHGLLMLLVGAFLVIYEKKLSNVDNEIFNMVYAGRYCILLMSMFSIYTGILYNEVFSMPMTLFGESHFVCPSDHSLPFSRCPEGPKTGVVMNPAYDTPYPFGVDPVWHGTKTELQFTNSMKMKMSVIMGVVQMTCGIFLSALNHRQSKDRLSMMYEFIPQVLFLSSMFGYLSILIMMKWTMGTREAPIKADLYHVMIYMFLQPGNVDCTNSLTGVAECPENLMFAGQGYLQLFLLLVMFVCVPMMLFPKPLILKKRHEARNASGFSRLEDDDDDDHHGGHGGEEFVFTDVLVHQIIHTIEFVLGAVSNTASYLRLWALSLAHAQLSAVFWERILMMGISIGNPVVMVVCFFMWAMTTLGVLMAMESLSAFLHALRLHWVEFQNKFYQGDGYKFVAFSFVDAGKELTGTA